jgi:hypothetical protein
VYLYLCVLALYVSDPTHPRFAGMTVFDTELCIVGGSGLSGSSQEALEACTNVSVDCPPLGPQPNTRRLFGSDSKCEFGRPGDWCIQECVPGMSRIRGSFNRECSGTGEWTGEDLVCVPHNAFLSFDETTSPGFVYSLQDGASLDTNARVVGTKGVSLTTGAGSRVEIPTLSSYLQPQSCAPFPPQILTCVWVVCGVDVVCGYVGHEGVLCLLLSL